MGRRPNAVISEWFTRGAKIEDSSNRYAHTCRRCGELFAKGRVEYLMQHLLKRCRNVTEADRSAILLQLQQTPAPKPSNRAASKSKNALNQYAGVDVGLPVSLERQQSALDTLAEVSRHHMDYSVQRQMPLEPTHFHQSDQDLAEQAMWAQLQQHNLDLPNQADGNAYDLANPSHPHEHPYNAESFVQGVSDPQQDFIHNQNSYHAGFNQLDPQLDPGTAAHLASTLQTNPVPSIAPNSDMPGQLPDNSRDEAKPTHADDDPVFINKYAPEVQQGNRPDNNLLENPRIRSRGRFTETRRREVQEIRKRGACIRCRMLKKPCSEGTPCKTCANVDVARLWKGRCLRTKLCDEFSGWNTQFFATMSTLSVQSSMLNEVAVPSLTLSVQLSAAADEDRGGDVNNAHSILLNTSLRHGQPHASSTRSHANKAQPHLVAVLEPQDSDVDQFASLCIHPASLSAAVSHEPNRLIAVTIGEASGLCGLSTPDHELLKAVSSFAHAGSSETRPSPTLASVLLRNTLQLWVITSLLTRTQLASSQSGQLLSFQLQDRQALGISDEMLASLTASNQHLIRLQLFAMLETKAAKLSRTVMVDLERHLLQRQQVSGYATFIVAVILLDCVERMTTFYSTFDADSGLHASASGMPFSAEDWSLPVPPSAVWSQGSSFAQLLQTLLRMRGLPPHTYDDERGMLAVVGESTDNIAKLNGNVSEAQLKAHEEERRQALTQWLRKCDVSAHEVRSWLQQSDGCRGKFVAGVLVEEL